jgi:hypothetical protein
MVIKMKFTHEELVNGIVRHESNSGAVLNTSREYLLLLEEEIDDTKQKVVFKKKSLTGSEVESLKQKFDTLYKQVSDVIANIGIYRNELLLREKMDASTDQVTNDDLVSPETKKEQFNKDYDDAFNFKDFSQDSKSGDVKGGAEAEEKKEEEKV